MNKVFIASDWYAHDFEGSKYQGKWSSVSVDVSYLESSHIDDSNNLILRQVSQLSIPTNDSNELIPTEVRYYISRYEENKSFEPSLSADFKQMGFLKMHQY